MVSIGRSYLYANHNCCLCDSNFVSRSVLVFVSAHVKCVCFIKLNGAQKPTILCVVIVYLSPSIDIRFEWFCWFGLKNLRNNTAKAFDPFDVHTSILGAEFKISIYYAITQLNCVHSKWNEMMKCIRFTFAKIKAKQLQTNSHKTNNEQPQKKKQLANEAITNCENW